MSEDYYYESDDESDLIPIPVTLILIDSTIGMFEQKIDGMILFRLVLKSILETLDKFIVSSFRTKFAIVSYSLEDKITEIVKFDQKLPESLLSIKKVMEMDDCALLQEYCCGREASLGDIFVECLKLFSSIKEKEKELVYFATNVNPHRDDPVKNSKCLNVIESFASKDIQFSLVMLTSYIEQSKLFTDITKVTQEIYSVKDYDDLLLELSIRLKVKAPHHTTELYLYDDQYLSVSLRYLTKSTAYKSASYFINRVNNKKLKKSVMNAFDEDKSRKFVMFGENTVSLNQDDIKNLSKDCRLGLNLLRVSKRQTTFGVVYRRPFVVEHVNTPKEIHSDLFNVIWTCCQEDNLTLICSYKSKVSKPRFVELIPNWFGSKQCFVAQFITHSDNLKPLILPAADEPEARDNVEYIKQAIKALKFTYEPHYFRDPYMEKFERKVRVELLGQDTPLVEKSTPGLVSELNSIKIEDEYKRLLDKPQNPVDEMVKYQVLSALKTNKWEKITKNQLKDFLTGKATCGLSSKTKNELIELVKQYGE